MKLKNLIEKTIKEMNIETISTTKEDGGNIYIANEKVDSETYPNMFGYYEYNNLIPEEIYNNKINEN